MDPLFDPQHRKVDPSAQPRPGRADDSTRQVESESASTTSGLGKYRVLDRIRVGHAATVYKARDAMLDRLVILKQLAPHLLDDPTACARFRREAYTLAQIGNDSRYVVTIHELIEANRGLFIVTEFVPGYPLETLISKRQLSLQGILEILARSCLGLRSIHCAGFVHRDLAPRHVMVDPSCRPRIVDFTMAATEGSDPDYEIVSPAYTAPEIFTRESYDDRVDIYSLGVIAYEMLVGRPTFRQLVQQTVGPTDDQVRWLAWHASTDEMWPDAHELNPLVPPVLSAIVGRMMSKSLDDRFTTIDDVLTLLVRHFSRAAMSGARMFAGPRSAPEAALPPVPSIAPGGLLTAPERAVEHYPEAPHAVDTTPREAARIEPARAEAGPVARAVVTTSPPFAATQRVAEAPTHEPEPEPAPAPAPEAASAMPYPTPEVAEVEPEYAPPSQTQPQAEAPAESPALEPPAPESITADVVPPEVVRPIEIALTAPDLPATEDVDVEVEVRIAPLPLVETRVVEPAVADEAKPEPIAKAAPEALEPLEEDAADSTSMPEVAAAPEVMAAAESPEEVAAASDEIIELAEVSEAPTAETPAPIKVEEPPAAETRPAAEAPPAPSAPAPERPARKATPRSAPRPPARVTPSAPSESPAPVVTAPPAAPAPYPPPQPFVYPPQPTAYPPPGAPYAPAAIYPGQVPPYPSAPPGYAPQPTPYGPPPQYVPQAPAYAPQAVYGQPTPYALPPSYYQPQAPAYPSAAPPPYAPPPGYAPAPAAFGSPAAPWAAPSWQQPAEPPRAAPQAAPAPSADAGRQTSTVAVERRVASIFEPVQPVGGWRPRTAQSPRVVPPVTPVRAVATAEEARHRARSSRRRRSLRRFVFVVIALGLLGGSAWTVNRLAPRLFGRTAGIIGDLVVNGREAYERKDFRAAATALRQAVDMPYSGLPGYEAHQEAMRWLFLTEAQLAMDSGDSDTVSDKLRAALDAGVSEDRIRELQRELIRRQSAASLKKEFGNGNGNGGEPGTPHGDVSPVLPSDESAPHVPPPSGSDSSSTAGSADVRRSMDRIKDAIGRDDYEEAYQTLQSVQNGPRNSELDELSNQVFTLRERKRLMQLGDGAAQAGAFAEAATHYASAQKIQASPDLNKKLKRTRAMAFVVEARRAYESGDVFEAENKLRSAIWHDPTSEAKELLATYDRAIKAGRLAEEARRDGAVGHWRDAYRKYRVAIQDLPPAARRKLLPAMTEAAREAGIRTDSAPSTSWAEDPTSAPSEPDAIPSKPSEAAGRSPTPIEPPARESTPKEPAPKPPSMKQPSPEESTRDAQSPNKPAPVESAPPKSEPAKPAPKSAPANPPTTRPDVKPAAPKENSGDSPVSDWLRSLTSKVNKPATSQPAKPAKADSDANKGKQAPEKPAETHDDDNAPIGEWK